MGLKRGKQVLESGRLLDQPLDDLSLFRRQQLQARVDAGEAPHAAVAQVHIALGEMEQAVDRLKEGAGDPGGRFVSMMNPIIRESLEALRADPTLGTAVDSLMKVFVRRPPPRMPRDRSDTTRRAGGGRSGSSPSAGR